MYRDHEGCLMGVGIYVVSRYGNQVGRIVWDGESEFGVERVFGDGSTLIAEDEWVGGGNDGISHGADAPNQIASVDRDAIRAQAVDAATERLSHTTLAATTRAAVADAIGVVAGVILEAVLPDAAE